MLSLVSIRCLVVVVLIIVGLVIMLGGADPDD